MALEVTVDMEILRNVQEKTPRRSDNPYQKTFASGVTRSATEFSQSRWKIVALYSIGYLLIFTIIAGGARDIRLASFKGTDCRSTDSEDWSTMASLQR